MKKITLLTVFGLFTLLNFSQNDGISYQAVIYNPNGEELPGYNNEMSPLVNSDICLRFSIYGNGIEYQEIVQTSTDQFGMVNLKIGVNQQTGGYANGFNNINWNDGNEKAMSVELDADAYCDGFEQISFQNFSYVPFAFYADDTNTDDIENLIAENQIASEQSDEALQAAIDANAAADLEESEAGAAADAAILESFSSAIEIAQEPIAANTEAIAANTEADLAESEAGAAADLALQEALENASAEATEAITNNAIAVAANAEAIAANTEADLAESEAGAAADLALQEALENASAEATEAITNNAIAVAGNAEAITLMDEAIAGNAEAITLMAEAIGGNAEAITLMDEAIAGNAEAITNNGIAVAVNVEAITNNGIAVAGNAEAIAAEVERATAAETANAEAIASIISGTGLSNDGSYETNPNTNYINESVSLVNATENLDSAIATLQELVDSLTERVETLEQLHVPVITLLGEAQISFGMSSGDYTDAGATADDLDDGDLTEQIVIVNGVDVLSPDTYFVTYNVTDSDGNEAEEVIRSITVIDDIAPIITLTGDSEITLELGSEYIEAGASAIDNVDGDLTNDILTTGSVDSNTAGTYTISYDVSDSSGNAANTVSRTIVVNAESESGSGFTNNNIESDSFTSTQEVLGGDNAFADAIKQTFIAESSGVVTGIRIMAYNSDGFGWDEIWVSFTTDVDTNNTWPSGDITFWNGTLSEQPSWLQIDLDNNFTVAEGSTYAFTLNSPSMCGAGTMISLNQDYSDGAMWHEGGCSSGQIDGGIYDIIFEIIVE